MQEIWRGVRGKSYLAYYGVEFDELSHLIWKTGYSCLRLKPVAIDSALWLVEGLGSRATRQLLGLYHKGALIELAGPSPVSASVDRGTVEAALGALIARMRSEMGAPEDVRISLSPPFILPARRNYNSGSSLKIVLAKQIP